jgi:acyl-CoA synthetase (NDP forming)
MRTADDAMDAIELLAKYNIPFVESAVAKTDDDAQRFADSIGYPIAMKIATDEPIHKTDIGGVRLNVAPDAVRQTFNDILKSAVSAGVGSKGVMIQQMAKPGIEVIVGLKQDRAFGPIVLFGLGGIYAEALHDVSIRVCPIAEQDAKEMVSELKSSAIFSSRGIEYDTTALVDVLMKASAMAITEPIRELDLNPVIVYPKSSGGGCLVVDVRAVRK